MATNTTRAQLRKPATSDNVDVAADLSANWDKVDDSLGSYFCTAGTRPVTNLYSGRRIFETDTWLERVWNATTSKWMHCGGKVPKVFTSMSAADSVANNAWEVSSWGTEQYEDTPSADFMHSTGTNPSRILLPIKGLWGFNLSHHWTANATGNRRNQVRMNAAGSDVGGTIVRYGTIPTLSGHSSIVSCDGQVRTTNTTDYIEAFAYQNSGGPLSVVETDLGATHFKAWLIHADDV